MNGKALSGLAKVEKTGLNQTVIISLINAAPVTEGEYYAVLCGTDKKYSCIVLGKNPASFTSALPFLMEIEEGFACLICFYNQNKATNIAFGTSGLVNGGVEEMKDALIKNISLASQINTDKQTEQKTVNIPPETTRSDSYETDNLAIPDIEEQVNESILRSDENKIYQDEIVATDNYYLNNDVDINNLTIKGENNEQTDFKDEYADYTSKKDVEKETITCTPSNNESLANLFKDPSTFDFDGVTKGNYFDKVKKELDTIFNEHPKEDALEKNIPSSKWAKIFYSDEKYYTVGLIYDESKPAYICYGVPGKYSKEPPSELKGFCSYLPLSIFDIKGDGYWMMYQNAESGECVHIDFI